MTRIEQSIEDRLARLGTETQSVVPRPDFVMRVMGSVATASHATASGDWSRQLLRMSRMGVVVAILAAAACIVVAWSSSSSADQEEALAYGMSEAFE
jgi:anti-sigma-K factor RskA